MRSAMLGLSLLLGAAALTGCVSQDNLDRAEATIRSLREQNQLVTQERDEARGEARILRDQLDQAEGTITALRSNNDQLRSDLGTAQSDISDIESQIQGMNFGAIDPITNRQLAALAAQYPNLMTYDPQRGMIRFAADLTFAKGSADVAESAKPSLQALANILKTGAAAQYDLRIVGHTDSQRLSAATQQQHRTNMHLSCHRAIGVRDVLMQMGVPAGKMQAAGWGEQRPLVPNNPTGETPANRRVEVFLVPSSLSAPSGAAPAGGQIPTDTGTPPGQPVEPIK